MEVGAKRGAHFQLVRGRDVTPQVIVELKSHEAETGSFHETLSTWQLLRSKLRLPSAWRRFQ